MSGTINFPSNPTVGQTYTFNNTTWVWTGTAWTNATTGQAMMPLAGGTFTGPVTMAGAATQANQPATLAQLNSAPYVPKNYVDNSGLWINQRVYASGTALAAGAYGLDRWKAGAAGGTLSFTSTPGSNVVTITAGSIQQVIEGQNFVTGPYTLSWAGTATGRIATASGGGTYAASPIQFNATANTNVFIEFTGGTLSQVQLQMGSVATPWQPEPVEVALARCQRYFQNFAFRFDGYGTTNGIYISATLIVQMRTSPSFTPTFSLVTNVAGPNFLSLGPAGYGLGGTLSVGTAGGGFQLGGTVNVSADL